MKNIEFKNIQFGYEKDKLLFDNLSFSITNKNGNIVGLMGESGSGKTTLLKLILGIEKPQRGTIETFPANPVMAYLPQEPVLFEHLSPLANAKYFSTTKFYKSRFDEKIFHDLVESLNLQSVLNSKKSILQLSGGQKQRLSLLQALSIKPDFLLLDEPTTGLDAEVKLLFLNKLKELALKYQLLVLYVTHHKVETELIVDEIVYLPKIVNNPISKVYQDSTRNFCHIPPLLEAVNVFKYPNPNLIKVKGTERELLVSNDEDYDYVAHIDVEMVEFSNQNGYDFSVKSSNQIYTMLELSESKQTISIHTEKFNYNNGSKITFVGDIPCYENGLLINNKTNEQ